MIKLGVQLYTVRQSLTKDTFNQIKEIGYDTVQLFGAVELVENCAIMAAEAGLEISGVLTDLDICEKDEEKIFQICKKYKISDIGISSVLADCKDIKNFTARVNAFAQKAKEEGFSFSYHNHGHEFIKLHENDTSMAYFMKNFNRENVCFMPDTYWIQDGGYDVRYFLDKTKGRVKIIHLKDIKRIETGHTFAEVGNGNLYMEGIIGIALNNGISHFIVEQDVCEQDPVESLRISYKNIKKILEN